MTDDDCPYCHGCKWVDEGTTVPWGGCSDHPSATENGAGDPCPLCNPCSCDEPPEMPPGFIIHKEGAAS